MTAIRLWGTTAGLVAFLLLSVGCGGPPIATPAPPSSIAESTHSVDVPASAGEGVGGEAATQQTCAAFRQMVEGIDTLSSHQQQELIDKMADAVQYTGNPDLMRAVVNMGQGWLNSNPQQFAGGMRALSKICNVPYQ
jgi:hypothetical protein